MADLKSDMFINGYGSFSGGEFQTVRINGLGKVKGDVHCQQFTTNGDSLIQGNIQTESLKVAGSSMVEGKVKTRETKVNGQLTTEAQMDTKDISINGSAVIKGKLCADQADIRGSITVEEDLEAEKVNIKGIFNIKGLLNAGKVYIELFGNAKAKEIGGEKIVVKKSGFTLNKLLKPLFADKSLSVDVIEGDEIELEYTQAKVVRGKNVKIGPGCKVDLVEYQDTYDADHEAEVKKAKQV